MAFWKVRMIVSPLGRPVAGLADSEAAAPGPDPLAGVARRIVTGPPVPLQMSRVQALPSSVHAVPFALRVSVGQVVLVPVQLSATSHSPAAERHTAPAFPAGCWQVTLVPSH